MFKADDLPLRRRTWLKLAAIPKNRIGWELSDCTDVSEQDLSNIREWLENAKNGSVIRAEGLPSCGVGLFLYGAPGHGKTTLSLAILQEIIRTFSMENFAVTDGHTMARPAYFIQYSTLLELKGSMMESPTSDEVRLWEGILGECKEDTYNVRVLVIDDIGKEHTGSGSSWHSAMLHHILRTRFNNGLPTIITSNLPDISKIYGEATDSFLNEACVVMRLQSRNGDLRRG